MLRLKNIIKGKVVFAFLLIGICIGFCPIDSPTQFQDSLLKYYPKAKNVDWSQSWNFYIATFNNQKGFENKVWMNNQAKWVMSVVDLQTVDYLPSKVYNMFMFSKYSQWTVNNVYMILFPNASTIYAMILNMDNSSTTYQVFFAGNGKIINSINVSYTTSSIIPQIFGIHN